MNNPTSITHTHSKMGSPFSSSTLPIMATIIITILLSSNHCYCTASILTKANATHRCNAARHGECFLIADAEATVEIMILDTHMGRLLPFAGSGSAITDPTNNRNVQACGNGAGNPSGSCGGDPTNSNACPIYQGPDACK